MVLLAFFLIAASSDWVPARWNSSDPQTLELLAGTPINCLLVEESYWSEAFSVKAASRGVATLGVIRPGEDAVKSAQTAMGRKLTGIVLEGEFADAAAERARKFAADSRIPLVELAPRQRLRFDSGAPVLGTYQGVWAGIRIEHPGPSQKTTASPTGNPWIDTNTGFLRFARAYSDAAFWIANTPPHGQVITAQRYMQVIADAEMVGARWVVALDADLWKRLMARDAAALADWKQINAGLKFYEDQKELRALRPSGQLALVQDVDSGALLTGGVMDMLAVQHTAARAVPGRRVSAAALRGAKVAVNIDPQGLDQEKKEALRDFARGGGTLVNGPPGWKMPGTSRDNITLDREQQRKVDDIWPDLHGLTNRKNLGARLFNVSSMLSYLVAPPDGKRVFLHLVNYSDYPVESVTAFFLGNYQKARVYTPDGVKDLPTYHTDEGTGVDLDKVAVSAILMVTNE